MTILLPNGYKLVSTPSLVIRDGDKKVKRTLKERFFSLPWHPLQTTKTIPHYKPNPKVLKDDINKIMYVHQNVYNTIEKELNHGKY